MTRDYVAEARLILESISKIVEKENIKPSERIGFSLPVSDDERINKLIEEHFWFFDPEFTVDKKWMM